MPKILFSLSYSIDQSPELIWSTWQTADFWRQAWCGKSQFFYIPAISFKVSGALKLQPLLPQYSVSIGKLQPLAELEFALFSSFHLIRLSFTLTGSNPTVLNVVASSDPAPGSISSIFDWLAKPYLKQHADRVADLCRELRYQPISHVASSSVTDQPDSIEHSYPSTGFFLWHLTNDWQKNLDKSLKPFNLTTTQWLLLFNLVKINEAKQEATTSSLAKVLNLHQVHVSDVIKILVKKHLVHKLKLQGDQRKFQLTATSQGKIVAIEAHTATIQAEKKFFSGLDQARKKFFGRFITQ